ncbi:hypothetical protein Drorol1_Dr00002834 [Drosera rotundifolia]
MGWKLETSWTRLREKVGIPGIGAREPNPQLKLDLNLLPPHPSLTFSPNFSSPCFPSRYSPFILLLLLSPPLASVVVTVVADPLSPIAATDPLLPHRSSPALPQSLSLSAIAATDPQLFLSPSRSLFLEAALSQLGPFRFPRKLLTILGFSCCCV